MSGIALNFGRPPVFNGDQNSARIGTIVRARGMDYLLHKLSLYWSADDLRTLTNECGNSRPRLFGGATLRSFVVLSESFDPRVWIENHSWLMNSFRSPTLSDKNVAPTWAVLGRGALLRGTAEGGCPHVFGSVAIPSSFPPACASCCLCPSA